MDTPIDTAPNLKLGGILITVKDAGSEVPIVGARITWEGPFSNKDCREAKESSAVRKEQGVTEPPNGSLAIKDLAPGWYRITYEAFFQGPSQIPCVEVKAGCWTSLSFDLPINFKMTTLVLKGDGNTVGSGDFVAGTPCILRTETSLGDDKKLQHHYRSDQGSIRAGSQGPTYREQYLDTLNVAGPVNIFNTVSDGSGASATIGGSVNVSHPAPQPVSGNVSVALQRSKTHRTIDQALWVAIRNRTRAIAFGGSGYKSFIDRVLVGDSKEAGSSLLARQLSEADFTKNLQGVAAYDMLKTATEIFLLLECGVVIDEFDSDGKTKLFYADEESGRLGEDVTVQLMQDRLKEYLGDQRLPYIKRILRAAFPGLPVSGKVHADGVLTSRVTGPCLLELIWSYWHEEGMIVQTINAISRRFQNVRGEEVSGVCGKRDPLAHLELDPLRPLNNLLWGYIQDERNRLTVRRRAYEYEHHYGLKLQGKAVMNIRAADVRSKFLEAFHHLLHESAIFFKEDNDTTIISDGFPLLNALKEVHLILAQGAHNQFGDLPWTSRAEMLIQQWLIARPEIRDFLQSRHMVPYKEAWMPQVDTMKSLQGWTDVTVTHFRDLAVYGEQILLSIRYADWIDVNDEDSAKNWARYWRPELQGYMHAYRAATGVDLTNPDTVDYTIPSTLLARRLAAQRAQ